MATLARSLRPLGRACAFAARTPPRHGLAVASRSISATARRSNADYAEALQPTPISHLTEEESMLSEAVSKFANEQIGPKVREMDEQEKMDPAVIEGCFEQGFMAFEIPEQYGGSGLNFTSAIIGIEELARVDPSVSVMVDVHSTLVTTAILKWASEENKKKWLPRLATSSIGSFCLSEPASGSDAFALKTRATKTEHGYRINGSKMWITNAAEAELFIVFANLNPDKGYKGITAFLVEKGTPGFSIAKKEKKLGIRASSTCVLNFDDVEIPHANLLGKEGEGYKYAIGLLNEGRIGIGAQMTGLALGAFENAAKYVLNDRKQFGQLVGTFQGMQHQMAQAWTEITAARALVYNAARKKEAGQDFVTDAAMAKLYASQVAGRVSSLAVEWMGGMGFVREGIAEKMYRDSKIGVIYEGTSNIQLTTIAKALQKQYTVHEKKVREISHEMANTNPADYKARKEAFVSNLSGSSITEINLVTLVAAAAIFLWTALQRRYGFFKSYGPLALATDFLLNVAAILFALTAYSSSPLFLNLALITPAGASSSSSSSGNANPPKSPRLVVRPFLTHYRGAMLIVTVIAILAVDFPIFPRRFAKVETWGTSLMDLGVGSFVYSAGLVSSRALFKTAGSSSSSGLAGRVLQASRHSIPLLVLGIIRLISVKGLDYAEHVSEYGVHWNFFFTLGLLPPFVELADAVVNGLITIRARSRAWSYALLALAISLMYEIVLDNTSLLAYILISPRGPDLLSKNREGVFSFIGYLAIFLSGRGTGSVVVQLLEDDDNNRHSSAKPSSSSVAQQHQNDDETAHERQRLLTRLATDAALSAALFWLTTSIHAFNLTVSRRLANLPYVLWVVAFNQIQICLFALNASSKVMQVFNKNGLVIFLVANLLTGLVNLTFNTLDASPIQAMAILTAYAAALSGFALALDYFGIRIKI
ncbi:hypothetical protein DV738_g5062, partial [Chaetothyriales sp. CBS 135597]